MSMGRIYITRKINSPIDEVRIGSVVSISACVSGYLVLVLSCYDSIILSLRFGFAVVPYYTIFVIFCISFLEIFHVLYRLPIGAHFELGIMS